MPCVSIISETIYWKSKFTIRPSDCLVVLVICDCGDRGNDDGTQVAEQKPCVTLVFHSFLVIKHDQTWQLTIPLQMEVLMGKPWINQVSMGDFPSNVRLPKGSSLPRSFSSLIGTVSCRQSDGVDSLSTAMERMRQMVADVEWAGRQVGDAGVDETSASFF